MGIFRKKSIDHESYLAFVSEYKEVMYRIAYGYLSNDTKAIDVVDEAVYLGYIHLKDLKEPKYLKTWLTRILINECYRILKLNKREITMENFPEEGKCSPDLGHLPIKLAVQALPEELRQVIVLRYFGDYTVAQTAEVLDIPTGTVATRTRKALQILRLELQDPELEEVRETNENFSKANKKPEGRQAYE